MGKLSWEAFAYEYIETPFFDDSRTKTFLGMRNFYQKVPSEVLRSFQDKHICVFAPHDVLGQVYAPLESQGPILFLSIRLEEMEQDEVDFVIAHEFAHVYLGHSGGVLSGDDLDIETPTDELVKEWGFSIPARRRL